MTFVAKIKCRARVSPACYQGKNVTAIYEGTSDMHADGTWDGSTVVCDACYTKIMPETPSGRGLPHEIEPAIVKMRESR